MNQGLKAHLEIAGEILSELKELKETEREVIACWNDATEGLEQEFPDYTGDILYFRRRFNELVGENDC